MEGNRDTDTAMYFMHDLRRRCEGRMRLTTDGYNPYFNAVEMAFQDDDVDHAQLVKLYGNKPGKTSDKNYSPGVRTGAIKTPVTCKPDSAHISKSYIERSNLTIRMSTRRFTRLTNAFSKKIDNHIHVILLYTVWYKFVRIHKTLRVSPAMAAGISDTLRDVAWTSALSRR